MKTLILTTCAIFMTCLAATEGRAQTSMPVVSTPYGAVTGKASGDTYAYLGIPYAASPTGQLRFKAPVAPKSWPQPLKATSYGPSCLQANLITKRIQGSEDCLTLNIWRPKKIAKQLPVLFFIHGGGNTIGGASDGFFGSHLYDGQKLAENGNVVVTINYRLGTLGFLAHPSLRTAEGLQGNYAALDQISALKFVKEAIANFGGNPNSVTVFGESAGAINTLVLIASPLAKGLFHRAIIESGFLVEAPLLKAEGEANRFAEAAGCNESKNVPACLRALTPEQILSASTNVSDSALGIAGPTIDGYVLKASILETIRAKSHNRVPVIIGTNRDEFRTLLPAVVNTGVLFTESDYKKAVEAQYGRLKAAKILERYRSVDHFFSPRLALEAALNDGFAHCPARSLTRALVAAGAPTYRYVFTHTGDYPIYHLYGAGHGLELPFVFGSVGLDRTFREHRFSREVRERWSHFAETATPNNEDLTPWPTGEDDAYLDLAPVSEAKSGFRNDACDFWDTLGY